MNFPKIAPFILFALCCLAPLLSQLQTAPQHEQLQCLGQETLPIDLKDDTEQSGQLKTQSEIKNEEKAISNQERDVTAQLSLAHLTNSPLVDSSPAQARKICSKRLLQRNAKTSNLFISGSALVFQGILLMSRNLILIGLFTNCIDLFLPLILLSEAFLMLAFWVCQKHYMAALFSNVFASYWDIFNAIRLLIQPSITTTNLPQLSQYDFSPIILFNLSGEFLVALLLLFFTVFSRVTAVCLRYEWLRSMAARLRPIWNGYFFAILPRIGVFTGLHWRLVGIGASFDVLNGIVCSLFSALIIFYFIALLVQTRRANSKLERVEDAAEGLGLIRRIDLEREFQFDCLRYSSIYFPCMNYLRMVVYCLPIGLFWDYYYLAYGGPIIAQMTIIMAEVSSSGYLLRRDRVLFPLQNFLLLIVQLCIITVGLAESVQHSQVSQIAQTLLLSLLMLIIGSSLFGVGLDTWEQLRVRCAEKGKEETREDGQSAQHFTRQLAKSSTISEVKRQNDSDFDVESFNQDDIIDHPSDSFKPSEKLGKLRIKKVRKGKVI